MSDRPSAAQQSAFTAGFIEAMIWATPVEHDYSEPAPGFRVFQVAAEDWQIITPSGSVEIGGTSRYEANLEAWLTAGLEAPGAESMTGFELADVTRAGLEKHCARWMRENYNLLEAFVDAGFSAAGWPGAGVDFFLTSAGHGAGFWDRDAGKLGEALTATCQGEGVEAYIGDDGLVYVCGMETAGSVERLQS